MEIIEETSKLTRPCRIKCNVCHTELEITAGNFSDISSDEISEILFFYICPCCFHTNYILGNDLPTRILLT